MISAAMDIDRRSNRKFIITCLACCFLTLTFLTSLMTRLDGAWQTHYNQAPPYLDSTAKTSQHNTIGGNENIKTEVDELLEKIKGISDKIKQLKQKLGQNSDKAFNRDAASNNSSWDDNWDKMKHLNRKTLFTTFVTLIVRGESIHGQLTNQGLRQMTHVARFLKDLYRKQTLKVIHAEDPASKKSAIEISRLASAVISQDSLLSEGYPGFPDPLVNSTHLPSTNIRGYLEFRDSARLEAGFRRFIHHGEKIIMKQANILVAPEIVMKYFILRSLQLPVSVWQRVDLAPGSISTITVAVNNDVFVANIGCVGHLSP